MKKTNLILTIIFAIAVFLLIITASIALPIYLRFFYYLQIEPLGLPKSTGYDYQTIKAAYDEVLDFLTLPSAPFGTGVFKYTESGMAHFYDCKVLFDLNTSVLIISAMIAVVLLILNKKKVIKLCRPFNMSIAFISAVSIFAFFGMLIILVCLDFDAAFIAFHHIFFPGKDNWLFDPRYDQILRILPQDFFMNCAILIASSIVIISVSIIVFQLIKRKKAQK